MKGKLLTIFAAVVFVLGMTGLAQATEPNVWVDDDWIFDEVWDIFWYEYEDGLEFSDFVEFCIFETIQEGVDGVDPGGTVNVLGGTYDENVIIPAGKDNLQILAYKRDHTFFDTGYRPNVTCGSGTAFYTSSPVTISGFDISGAGRGSGTALHIRPPGSGCPSCASGTETNPGVFEDNRVHHVNYGMKTGDHCNEYWNFKNNEFYELRIGIGLENFQHVEITGNSFADYKEGVSMGWDADTAHYVDITDNTFLGTPYCPDCLAAIVISSAATNIQVSNNEILNSIVGVLIKQKDATVPDLTDVYIRCNSIVGNTEGVKNEQDIVPVDAIKNWWGDADGPGPVGPGAGDVVSANVDYFPWLITDNIEYCDEIIDPNYQGCELVVVNGDWTGKSPGDPVSAVGYGGFNFGYNAFDNIQDGIDNVCDSTVLVLPGTYNEHIVIDRSDITLRSAEGKDNTIVTLQNGTEQCGIDFRAGADNCVLGGEAGHGFTLEGPASRVIQFTHNITGVEISHNTIDCTGSTSMGINIGAAGADGLKVIKNEFIAEESDGSIYGWSASNMFVCGNTFTGPGDSTSGYAIQLSGMNASDITNNTIDGYGMGIFLQTVEGPAGVSDVTISNNRVRDCAKGIRLGYYLEGYPDVCDVIVTDNELRFNTVGIYVSDSNDVVADTFVIKDNRIAENTDGLKNDNDVYVVDATNNWWGDPCGPGPVGPGSGDSVSVNVDYAPWWVCGSTVHPCLDGDLNHNGKVNNEDFAIFADHWLEGPTPWCE